MSFFLFKIFPPPGGWVKIKPKLPHFHISDTCRAAATGRVSMSTRPDPRRIWHSGHSHLKMPSSPGSVGLARAYPLTKTQAMELPARLGPVTVHPTRWGVGPRSPKYRCAEVSYDICDDSTRTWHDAGRVAARYTLLVQRRLVSNVSGF